MVTDGEGGAAVRDEMRIMPSGYRRRLALGVLLGAFSWAEWRTWRASRDFFPPAAPRGDEVTVVVLGCPSPRVQRWRVQIAMRSANASTACFLFTGGAVHTARPEAHLMADYAASVGIPRTSMLIEDKSRNTVENIVNSAPMLADDTSVMIVSNSFHARRARMILLEQAPDLAARLIPARDYIPLEGAVLHLGLYLFEWYRTWRAQSN